MTTEFYFAGSLLLTYLLHSTFTLGLAWLILRLSMARNPAIRETVWKIAAIAPLITVCLQTAITTQRWEIEPERLLSAFVLETVEERKPSYPLPDQELTSLSNHFDGERVREQGETLINDDGPEIASGNLTKLPVELDLINDNDNDSDEGASLPVLPLGYSAWFSTGMNLLWAVCLLIGGLGLWGIVHLLASYSYLNRALRKSQPLTEGPLFELLHDLLKRSHVRRLVHLYQLEEITEPAATGFRRGQILLPLGIEDELSHDELEAVLAHELAHLVRHDISWLWLGRILCWLCPFQPLNFVAHREWQRAAESMCDAWALSHGIDRFALARSLTSIASRTRTRPVPLVLTVTGSGGSQLTRRVEQLLEDDGLVPPSRWQHRLACIACLGTLAILLFVMPTIELSAETSSLKVTQTQTQSDDVQQDETVLNTAVSEYLQQIRTEANLLHAEAAEINNLSQTQPPAVREHTEKVHQQTEELNQRLEELQRRWDVLSNLSN
ncbi:heat shock protein HtpX [Polystyrenella longa]|uniref:Heat shock protein HtpX n=1 Tax=Polystyrenella longa TaxID=2528007 RepID=A0A518CSR1_9PLAN|nr:M56 family metallopeptidase [Polystyrenella longa]QDU82271.1 heat shock protein HtpX [Polystyrenella longa]